MVRRSAGILLALFMLSGCVASLPTEFYIGSLPVPLRTRVVPMGSTARGYELTIGETLAIAGTDRALYLGVSGGFGSIELAVKRGDAVIEEVTLSPVPGTAEHGYLVPVRPGVRINTITIDVFAPEEGFSVREAGLTDRSWGVRFEYSARIDTDVAVSIESIDGGVRSVFDFSRIVDSFSSPDSGGIALTYRLGEELSGSSASSGSVRLAMSDATGNKVAYRLHPQPGGGTVYLYAASAGLVPTELMVESTEPRFAVVDATFVRDAATGDDPIPSDLSAIVEYSIDSWRNAEYEIFRWNRFPSIIIFDTRDYAVQAALFKRLAFFVEKRGFTGRVLTDAELEGRHGWNAHDYRSIDLANFFSTAGDDVLNRLEIELRAILVREKIIVPRTGGYEGGEGGVLSISQESTPRLRDLFMVHEGYHGVYFADERFREAAFSVWARLDPREREFWRLFLASRAYDPADEYLMVNEFQAYLLQQPLVEVDSYFTGFIVPRLAAVLPAHSGFLEALLEDFPRTFSTSAAEVLDAAKRSVGIDLSSLHCLEPITP